MHIYIHKNIYSIKEQCPPKLLIPISLYTMLLYKNNHAIKIDFSFVIFRLKRELKTYSLYFLVQLSLTMNRVS